mmetsp:Transcript_9658/g.18057  ORF Transcript_9658/g.18057 Transcript_9658/m.18057 type:complete len:101 (+) Transcript_9658:1217-1519(+)
MQMLANSHPKTISVPVSTAAAKADTGGQSDAKEKAHLDPIFNRDRAGDVDPGALCELVSEITFAIEDTEDRTRETRIPSTEVKKARVIAPNMPLRMTNQR